MTTEMKIMELLEDIAENICEEIEDRKIFDAYDDEDVGYNNGIEESIETVSRLYVNRAKSLLNEIKKNKMELRHIEVSEYQISLPFKFD